jgi:hypothetical protein
MRSSGEDPQFFGDPPFARRIPSPETHGRAKLKCIGCLWRQYPLGETLAVTSWVGKIRPWGFIARKTKPPDRDSNTLNR